MPLHPLKIGVIVYVTVPDTFPILAGESAIGIDEPEGVTVVPLIGPLIELVHVKVVPEIEVVGVKLSATLLQIVV
jgi:hypothetical protein